MTLGVSTTAFANQNRGGGRRGFSCEIRMTTDIGNGFRHGACIFDGEGLCQRNPGRALSPRGMMLRDGSCYVAGQ